jgi:hypothetical protein
MLKAIFKSKSREKIFLSNHFFQNLTNNNQEILILAPRFGTLFDYKRYLIYFNFIQNSF